MTNLNSYYYYRPSGHTNGEAVKNGQGDGRRGGRRKGEKNAAEGVETKTRKGRIRPLLLSVFKIFPRWFDFPLNAAISISWHVFNQRSRFNPKYSNFFL